MTDRELLELAAKAAGYDTLASTYGWADIGGGVFLDANDPPATWNPMTDDGDALRLAVTLGMDVQQFTESRMVEVWKHPLQASGEDYGSDKYAATRRAIVRAAAELGRSMP